MTIRRLPAIALRSPSAGLSWDIPEQAVQRWDAGIRAAADGEQDSSISILGPIGENFWRDGVSSRRIAGALRAIGSKPVTVNVNSPGGDYFEGLAIYNMLRQHPEHVTINVLGLAASAASVIAMAGDDVRIARAGFFMIHNVQVLAGGDRAFLRETADTMESFDAAAADVYAARTGIDATEIGDMMDAETWIPGSKAVDMGFADDVLAADAVEEDDAPEARARMAGRSLDLALAKAGLPKAERRKLISGIRGTSRAAPSGTSRAADDDTFRAVVDELAASLRLSPL